MYEFDLMPIILPLLLLMRKSFRKCFKNRVNRNYQLRRTNQNVPLPMPVKFTFKLRNIMHVQI